MELLGDTLEVIGTVMISYMAISVHIRVREEHKIDEVVFTHMKKEQIIGILGILLIIFGYLLKVAAHLGL